MINHEFGSASASQIEAPRIEGAELPRPKLAKQAHSRAIDMLHATRRHYGTALAVTLATLGFQAVAAQPDSAYADHDQSQEPVVGLYQAYLPAVGRGADFRIVRPGYTPTPIVDPTEPRPSPTEPRPSPTMPSPTPTEVRPTATPEVEKVQIGLSDQTIGSLDGPNDPYAPKTSLEAAGILSTDADLIDFDAEADGTGFIATSDGTPVYYRLKLTEPGESNRFFEVEISVLRELVTRGQISQQELDTLLQREYNRDPNSAESIVTHIIADSVRPFDTTGPEPQPVIADEEKIQASHFNPFDAHNPAVTRTHTMTDNPHIDKSHQDNEPDQDSEKSYGRLKPFAGLTENPALYIHYFHKGLVEVPNDSGFSVVYSGTFPSDFGCVNMKFNNNEGLPQGGIALGVVGDKIIFGSYDEVGNKVDGPYELDALTATGRIDMDFKILTGDRTSAELKVIDKDGSAVYYRIDLPYPPTQSDTMRVDISSPFRARDQLVVDHADVRIPTNPNRAMAGDRKLDGLNELNTHREMPDVPLGMVPMYVNEHGIGAPDAALLQDVGFILEEAIHGHDRSLHVVNDPVIQDRPFLNGDRRALMQELRDKNPQFFAAISYDMRQASMHQDDLNPAALRDILKKYHLGADSLEGILIDSPHGLIGPSGKIGNVGALLAGGITETEALAKIVAAEFVASMPEGTTWHAAPELEAKMLFGLNQKDNLVKTLNAMNSVPGASVKDIIVTDQPDYSMPGEQYAAYLKALASALNEIGVTVHIRMAGRGIMTIKQMSEILSRQTTDRQAVLIISDPRDSTQKSSEPDQFLDFSLDGGYVRKTDAMKAFIQEN